METETGTMKQIFKTQFGFLCDDGNLITVPMKLNIGQGQPEGLLNFGQTTRKGGRLHLNSSVV
jgi:hypothetical protein